MGFHTPLKRSISIILSRLIHAAPSAMQRARRGAVLGLVIVATSVLLAILGSIWLVPPYVVLMIWLLAPAVATARAKPANTGPQSNAPPESTVSCADHVPASSDVEPAAPQDAPVQAATPTRRRRSRKSARERSPEPSASPAQPVATWVRVGPGQYVRVEGPLATDDQVVTQPTEQAIEIQDPPCEINHETSAADVDANEFASVDDQVVARSESGEQPPEPTAFSDSDGLERVDALERDLDAPAPTDCEDAARRDPARAISRAWFPRASEFHDPPRRPRLDRRESSSRSKAGRVLAGSRRERQRGSWHRATRLQPKSRSPPMR